MNEFLQYYESELAYMHRALGEFERTHPQKASQLQISAGRSQDPDLQRIADSFALIAARLNQRLDGSRPEISLDLLRMMCPGFMLGAPSYATLAPSAEMLEKRTKLERGTAVYFDKDGSPFCKYSVARDVTLVPASIEKVKIENAPFRFEVPREAKGAEVAICITVGSTDREASLKAILDNAFEFYVTENSFRKNRICNFFAGPLKGISIAADAQDTGTSLPVGQLVPTLCLSDANILPTFLTQPPGMELLRDYLCYPDKGSFFTLSNLQEALPDGPLMEIRFFAGAQSISEMGQIEKEDFLMNVVPCINLFTSSSQPCRYDFARDRVPVSPISQTKSKTNVLRIETVHKITSDGEFKLSEMTDPQRQVTQSEIRWHERHLFGQWDKSRREISFSVKDGQPKSIDFIADLLCSNGSGGMVPRPGDLARMELGPLTGVEFYFLAEPTASVVVPENTAWQWKILSLINGNFGAILDAASSVQALREALNISSPTGHSGAAEGITEVLHSEAIAPVRIGKNMILAAGTIVEVVIDVDLLPYPSFIFARVLDDFLAAFVSYDRFVELRVRARGETVPIVQFPRRHGSQLGT